jgi:hypothetical protein
MISLEISHILTKKPFVLAQNNALLWCKVFGIRSFLTPDTIAIPILPVDKRNSKIRRISEALEILIHSKSNKAVEDTILQDAFSKKDMNLVLSNLCGLEYLYGITVLSVCEGIEFIYKTVVTSNLTICERIIVEDDEVRDLVIGNKLCRGKRNLLVPFFDTMFSSRFFKSLKDIVRGRYDEADNAKDTRSKGR